jgi:hypothetical protein
VCVEYSYVGTVWVVWLRRHEAGACPLRRQERRQAAEDDGAHVRAVQATRPHQEDLPGSGGQLIEGLTVGKEVPVRGHAVCATAFVSSFCWEVYTSYIGPSIPHQAGLSRSNKPSHSAFRTIIAKWLSVISE